MATIGNSTNSSSNNWLRSVWIRFLVLLFVCLFVCLFVGFCLFVVVVAGSISLDSSNNWQEQQQQQQ